ncbi:MAG: DUF4159 domain-containing protein [Lentisphaerae bacterium]|mgnify:CR=1 FL=1|jgi:hypothetical protein|nr:DUF4159 domain-containing protein [Lentisphaerota bacterium]
MRFLPFVLIFFFCGVGVCGELRIGQLLADGGLHRGYYPNALPSLLRHIRETTTANVAEEPVLLADFSDARLFELPFVYVNCADRPDWTFTEAEKTALKSYLLRGGFLYIDAGITAAFLREHPEYGQHHSYAEWEASPEIKAAFKTVFPDEEFETLKRSDELYRTFYSGLPDTSLLPDTVRSYTEKEKWPDGTYAAAVLRIDGRVAVLTTPIVAMGWGKNRLGQWDTTIRFRVLEETTGLDAYLGNAAYGGAKFEVAREDGAKDIIYCQEEAMPSWANEPGGKWRIFKYYGSREISDFAHQYYTQLGTNIVVYALTR